MQQLQVLGHDRHERFFRAKFTAVAQRLHDLKPRRQPNAAHRTHVAATRAILQQGPHLCDQQQLAALLVPALDLRIVVPARGRQRGRGHPQRRRQQNDTKVALFKTINWLGVRETLGDALGLDEGGVDEAQQKQAADEHGRRPERRVLHNCSALRRAAPTF